MCGIAGFMGPDVVSTEARPWLERMIHPLAHRGPDGFGFHAAPSIGLAHARLSIIDLSTGDQPIHNPRRTVWTVFNGEIFNFVELRQMLEAKGHQFYTQSDTEVIVHLYDRYGEDFVQHLNGQFAIALWDGERQRLVLARDRQRQEHRAARRSPARRDADLGNPLGRERGHLHPPDLCGQRDRDRPVDRREEGDHRSRHLVREGRLHRRFGRDRGGFGRG